MKALAVTSAKRIAALPQTPAVAESGFPDFDVAARYGFFAPARTPHAIVTRLNRELRAILEMPDVRERLAALGLETIPSTPEAARGRRSRPSSRAGHRSSRRQG